MGISDLHIHTYFSDGHWSPQKIVEECVAKKIKYFAITDHDNLSGYRKARDYIDIQNIKTIKIIPGIEISSSFRGSKIHLLTYFINPDDPDLNEYLKILQVGRTDFAKFALNKLKEKGIQIEWGDLIKNSKGSVGRLHIARCLVENKIVKNTNEAFETYLHGIKNEYEKDFEIDSLKILEVVKNAGGVCSIAHPHTVKNFESIITDLSKSGLVGIEIVEGKELKNIDQIMSELKLIKTAGSDFHSQGRKSFLGKYSLNETEFEILYETANKKLKGNIGWNI